jgi:putative ABC transport system permease protein
MGALRMLTGAELRRRWHSVVVLTILVGFAGAVALALLAGARRTDTALQRFEAWSRSADIEIDAGDATPAQIEEFRRSPGVGAVAELRQMTMTTPGAVFLPTAAQTDARFGTVTDRAKVVDGREADLTKVDELTIGEALAAQLHVRVGDRLRFSSYSPADIVQASTGNTSPQPHGPQASFRIVGIIRRPLDLGGRGAAGGVIVPSPAWLARYRDEIGSFGGAILRVRTDHGSRDLPQVSRAATRIFGGSPQFSFTNLGAEGKSAQNAIDVTSVGLYLAAGVAALTAIVAIGIALSREIGMVDVDQPTLRALGARPRERIAAAAGVGLPVALVGALLAILGALVASTLFPIGVASKAEIEPGIRTDPFVLVVGFALVALLVAVIALLAGWRTASVRDADAGRARPSVAARTTAEMGAAPVLAVGVRFALERGWSRRALPVLSSVIGAAFGVIVVTAVLVFSSGLHHLVSTPSAYGWTWDTPAGDETAVPKGDDCGPMATRLVHLPELTAVTSICNSSVAVQGRPVLGEAFRQLRGRIEPATVVGRPPETADEVMLGADTLSESGRRVGDRVRITGPEKTRTFRIVGQGVFVGLSDPQALADGAAFTPAGLSSLGKANNGWNLVVNAAPGVDRAALVRKLQRLGGSSAPPPSQLVPVVPTEIERVHEIRGLPIALAAFVGVVAAAAVAFALVTSVRRRRRDLAVLKTLGFRRGQVRATVAWQATTIGSIGLLVGVPLGLFVGRFVWQVVADDLGVSNDPTWPVLGVSLLVPAVLLLVNAIAAFPARAAAHTRPAVVLRSE